MDLYLFTLSLGFGGLLLMTLLGLSHGGHHGVRGGQHGAGHHHGGPQAHGHHGPAAAKFKVARSKEGGSHGSRGHLHLLSLLSPRVLFGLLFGFGAAGMLVHPWLPASPLAVLAVALLGAWTFERGMVQPLWNLLMNFASKPAQTLDTLVLEEGQAATDFDRTGHGLVLVDLDGQTRQILGTLCPEERGNAARVRTGDRLFIRAIDGARNTCTVSRLSC